ncbi:MAG: MGMT family protein [Promethearchaeota archaeon]
MYIFIIDKNRFLFGAIYIKRFTKEAIKVIKNIPRGKVLTYGQIAKLAGNPRTARQVSWILHSSSRKYRLPWHRVINSKGKVSLKDSDGKNRQKYLLEKEGIVFKNKYKIELSEYLWKIESIDDIKDI